MVVVLFVGIVKRQRGDHRAQHLHGRRRLGNLLHHADNVGIDPALAGQAAGEILQLFACRQLAIPQQVASFLKGGMIGEVVNIVAAICQNAAIAVDVADA